VLVVVVVIEYDEDDRTRSW